ncbi:MAG: dihydrodipicolinate synthase family protein, partial [Planctomycetota bacterium]
RTQLKTRLERDMDDRNYSLDKAVATFLHSNLREFNEHGAESKNWSDIHLFCSEDYRLRIESVAHEVYEEVETILHEDMEDLLIAGLIVPLLSPFDENGALDPRAFAEHLNWLTERGVRRILVGGTTGEFFALTVDERLELLKLALEYFPGLILFQVGAGDVRTSRQLAQRAEQLGADGVLSLPPYYYSYAPQKGLIRWFQRVGSDLDIPFILYNFPEHAGVSLTPEVLSKVDHYGMKDSSADMGLVTKTPRYFVGGDPSILESARRGGVGFVSGAANVHPTLYVKMEKVLKDEHWAQAELLQDEITRQVKRGDEGSSIAIWKSELSRKLDCYPARVRPPLIENR